MLIKVAVDCYFGHCTQLNSVFFFLANFVCIFISVLLFKLCYIKLYVFCKQCKIIKPEQTVKNFSPGCLKIIFQKILRALFQVPRQLIIFGQNPLEGTKNCR